MGFWNSANAVEMMSNAMIYFQTSNLTHVFQNVYNHQIVTDITDNGSYDDVLWWSLAWARAYNLTGQLTLLL